MEQSTPASEANELQGPAKVSSMTAPRWLLLHTWVTFTASSRELISDARFPQSASTSMDPILIQVSKSHTSTQPCF